MKPPNNDIIPQNCKMTDNTALGVGVQNLEPRLPDEWEVVKLGEVADIVMGQSPPGSSYNETGVGLPFLQGKTEFGPLHPLHIKYTTTPIKIAPKGSVLLSVRAPVGDVNLANIDYCIGRGLASISLSSGKNIFLFYILTYLKNEIEKEGTGSIFKAINKTKLLDFKIPLPPLPEQQKIASVLSAVQEAKEKTEAVIDATKALKKSMMQHLFTYGPVSPQEAETVPLKETEIGMVREDWEVVRLGDIGNIITGNTPSKNKKEYWEKGEIEFIKPPDLQNQKIVTFSEKISNSAVRKARIVHQGTILVSCIGIIGRVGLSQKSIAFNQQINAIVPKEKIYNHFLFYAIQVQQKQIEKLASFTTVPIVSKAKFSTVKIPLPPLPTQQKIASILSAIDVKIEAEENKKQALEELFKTLLDNLMTAKIRVNYLEVPS